MNHEVKRDDLRTTRWVDDDTSELADGEARLRVDLFALTANNVTYAVFGDAMRYWSFFPVATRLGSRAGVGLRRRRVVARRGSHRARACVRLPPDVDELRRTTGAGHGQRLRRQRGTSCAPAARLQPVPARRARRAASARRRSSDHCSRRRSSSTTGSTTTASSAPSPSWSPARRARRRSGWPSCCRGATASTWSA